MCRRRSGDVAETALAGAKFQRVDRRPAEAGVSYQVDTVEGVDAHAGARPVPPDESRRLGGCYRFHGHLH